MQLLYKDVIWICSIYVSLNYNYDKKKDIQLFSL